MNTQFNASKNNTSARNGASERSSLRKSERITLFDFLPLPTGDDLAAERRSVERDGPVKPAAARVGFGQFVLGPLRVTILLALDGFRANLFVERRQQMVKHRVAVVRLGETLDPGAVVNLPRIRGKR